MALADFVISLDNGRIREVGSPTAVAQSHGFLNSPGFNSQSEGAEDSQKPADLDSPEEQKAVPINDVDQEDQRHADLRRKNGEKAVYKYYLKNAGLRAVVLYLCSLVLWTFLSEFPSELPTDHSTIRARIADG